MLNLFRKPTVANIIDQQIDDAQRALLEALNGQEYAKAMVDYHTTRLNRLQAQRGPATLPAPRDPLNMPITMIEPEEVSA